MAYLTTQNKTFQQKVSDLLTQISVGNKSRFGSKSQKGIRKNSLFRIERRTRMTSMVQMVRISSASQADAASADAAQEPVEQTEKSYENRKRLKYQTMNADNRIVNESDINLLP